jgi:hypothetical protein
LHFPLDREQRQRPKHGKKGETVIAYCNVAARTFHARNSSGIAIVTNTMMGHVCEKFRKQEQDERRAESVFIKLLCLASI